MRGSSVIREKAISVIYPQNLTSKSVSKYAETPSSNFNFQSGEVDVKKYTFDGILRKIKEEEEKNDQKQIKLGISKSKTKIWNKSENNHIFQELNIRKKIFEIKKNVRENQSINLILNNLDKSYFSTASLGLIYDSSRIIKDKLQHENVVKEKESISKFIKDNKEIFIKNNIIKLLDSEMKYIKHKENSVRRIIKEAESKLESDLKDFNYFIENEKEIQKENEGVLSEYLMYNRRLQEEKRVLVQNNRLLTDELDKAVKISLNLMSNAYFVSYSLKTKLPSSFIEENFEFNNFEYINDNDITLEALVNSIIKEFGGKLFEVPSDPNRMINRVKDLEKEIIKKLEKNEQLEKEKLRLEIDHSQAISMLEAKLNEVKEERRLLMIENNKVESLLKKYTIQMNEEATKSDSDVIKCIKEFNFILSHEEVSKGRKNTYNKGKEDPTKALIDQLKQIEYTINTKISNIENYETTKKQDVEFFVTKRRETNKETKIKEQKLKKEMADSIKRKRAKERMKRIVIKGKKVIKNYNLYDQERHTNSYEEEMKENNEASLLMFQNEN